MKNTIMVILCSILAFVLIPLLNLKKIEKDDNIIKVLNVKSNKVYEMDLEYYVTKVLAKEMSPTFENEALKAQAVAIRTYALKRMANEYEGHNGADVCTDYGHCMAYLYDDDMSYGSKKDEYIKIYNKAVKDTLGEIVCYEDEMCYVYFHAISGGITQNSKDVWGGDFSYLTSVNSEFDKLNESFETKKEIDINEMALKLDIPKEKIIDYKIIKFESGYVKQILFGNIIVSGEEIRKKLGLRSACFDVKIDNDVVCFTVYGYGHGVGMSQNGANEMAKKGYNYTEILKHYYKGTEIKKHPSL